MKRPDYKKKLQRARKLIKKLRAQMAAAATALAKERDDWKARYLKTPEGAAWWKAVTEHHKAIEQAVFFGDPKKLGG